MTLRKRAGSDRIKESMLELVWRMEVLVSDRAGQRKFRNLFTNILLVGIVPGNEGMEPKSLDPFLEVLVGELLHIYDSTLHDAYAGAPFKAKASILLHVLDYPGISKVMGVVGSGGIQGCAFCSLSGERSEQLHKTVYLQNRRFLLPSSPLRTCSRIDAFALKGAPAYASWRVES